MNSHAAAESWRLRDKNADAAREMWDAAAPQFAAKALPTAENHGFLALLEQERMVQADSVVLDIGCGGGALALALAKQCRHVTAIDLSPKMIALAKERAAAEGISNVEFRVVDWHRFDLEAAGFAGAFDLVYAHMSPAIQSAETLEKLCRAGKNHCALVKPVHRKDAIDAAIRGLLGWDADGDVGGRDFVHAFACLWHSGYLPGTCYRQQTWVHDRPLAEAIGFYCNRFKAAGDLTPAEEEKIENYLETLAKGGNVHDEVATVLATLYWQVN